ncbi:cutinase family protein [Mycobacterium sp. pUA109]|uniref:cutinase family protein n=1 Tax=Mycobacterium sp. pUA109 TaxID=3238982 RepID=UPI00351B3CD0
MTAHHIAHLLGPAVVTAWGLSASVLASAIPSASAEACPDTEVVFARGTGEPPGVGPTGQAFVNALGARLGGQPLAVYPVNYPASDAWATGVNGVRDAGAHIVSRANHCPQTRMVLGGYSQGAAVMGFVTSPTIPDGVDPASVPKPLDPSVADHVAAVVLFGTPNARAMSFLNQPPLTIGSAYQPKTLQLCVPEDPVCSDGMNFAAHNSYVDEGNLINQGADFAANSLRAQPGVPVSVVAPRQGFGS